MVVKAVVQPLFVGVGYDFEVGFCSAVLVAVPGAATVSVGGDAVVLPLEFTCEFACAVVHGDEVALPVVAVAHQGDGLGGAMVRVVVEFYPGQPPAVILAPRLLCILAGVDALVLQAVASAYAVGDGDQAARGQGVAALGACWPLAIAVLALAVLVALTAAESVDLGAQAPRLACNDVRGLGVLAGSLAGFCWTGCEDPKHVGVAAGGKDAVFIAGMFGADVFEAWLMGPRWQVAFACFAAAQQPDVFAGDAAQSACGQVFFKGALPVDGLRSQALGRAKLECATAFNVARSAACAGWKAEVAHARKNSKLIAGCLCCV